MVDSAKVELDSSFLRKFFGLTDRVPPQEVNMDLLNMQLDEIDEILKSARAQAKQAKVAANATPTPQPAPNSTFFENSTYNDDGFNIPKKTILIIDDLGVITYQLSVLFEQYNYSTTTSKEIYDAIEKFKKQSFDLVIMDLFIPTEREGFILLEELKKVAANKQKPTKIGVMSASPKKEHKHLCKMKGAEFYIEKVDNWQKDLFGIIKNLK